MLGDSQNCLGSRLHYRPLWEAEAIRVHRPWLWGKGRSRVAIAAERGRPRAIQGIRNDMTSPASASQRPKARVEAAVDGNGRGCSPRQGDTLSPFVQLSCSCRSVFSRALQELRCTDEADDRHGVLDLASIHHLQRVGKREFLDLQQFRAIRRTLGLAQLAGKEENGKLRG